MNYVIYTKYKIKVYFCDVRFFFLLSLFCEMYYICCIILLINRSQEKNKGREGWEFMSDGGEGNDYYKFCLHCLERHVDPRPLCEQARKVKEDREVKHHLVGHCHGPLGLLV